jgi:hypothetical protein
MLPINLATDVAQNLIKSLIILVIAFVTLQISNLTIKLIVKNIEDEDDSTDTDLEKRTYTLVSVIKNAISILKRSSLKSLIIPFFFFGFLRFDFFFFALPRIIPKKFFYVQS